MTLHIFLYKENWIPIWNPLPIIVMDFFAQKCVLYCTVSKLFKKIDFFGMQDQFYVNPL